MVKPKKFGEEIGNYDNIKRITDTKEEDKEIG